MKRLLALMSVGVMLTTLTAAAFAQQVHRLKVTIPFDFYVQDQLMPSGDYIFQMQSISGNAASASSIAILRGNKTVVAIVLTNPGTSNMGENHVHFVRYGNKTYLSKVENVGLQANMNPSKSEKILRAQIEGTNAKVAAAR